MCNAEGHGKYLLPTAMRLIGMLDSPYVRRVAPDSPGARELIALSDEYLGALYPPEVNFLESVESLKSDNVCFMGIEDDGTLVACGAVKLMEDDGPYGEIKRVFVRPEHRGMGHGRSVMLALESRLRQKGISLARLEAGNLQPEALGLYAALGYQVRGPFGAYAANQHSVFMEKVIAPSP